MRCPLLSQMSDLRPISRRWIKVGGGRLFSDFQGDVLIRCPDGSSSLLRDVLLVEGLGVDLLSAKKFCERNDAIGIFNDKEMLFRNKNKELILSAKLEDNLYKVNHISGPNERALLGQDSCSDARNYMPMTIDNSKNNLAIDDSEPLRSRAEIIEKNRADRYWLHHRRCGHAGTRVISLLHTITDIDRPIKIPSNLELCDICLSTKMKKFRSKKLSEHKDEKLALVSVDIAGPFPESIDGHKYFVEIIDSYTRKKWVLLLKSKSEIVTALDEWGNLVERQSGCLILAVRSDNASEILKVLKSWRRNNGVVLQTTAPYSSHQNGAAERAIQSTVYATRAMLKEAGLTVEFWAEAAQIHTYITNRIRAGPTLTKNEGENMITKRVSPEEASMGNPVSIRHLRIFGCKAFAHIDRKSHSKHSRKDKLMDVGRECIFVGYTDTMSQYRLYAPDLHGVFTSSYTKFKENDKESSIKDLRLWRKSGLEFTEGQGNSSPAIRNAPGRPCRISKRKSLNGGGSFAINSGFNFPNIQTESISTIPSTITPNITEKSIPSSTTESLEPHNDYATDIKVSNLLNQEDKASIMQQPVVPDTVGVKEPNSKIGIIESKILGDHISPRRSERLKKKRIDHVNQDNSVNTGEKLTGQSLLNRLSSKSKNMKNNVQLNNDSISISLPKMIESNLKSPILSKSLFPSGQPMHEKNQQIQSTLSLLHPKDSNTKSDDAQLKHTTIKAPLIQVTSVTIPPDKAQLASSSVKIMSIQDDQQKQTDKPHNIENNTSLALPHNPLTELMIIDDNKLKVYAGEKRKRSDLYEIEKDEERRSKILKAMLAIIDIVDEMDSTYTENAFLSEFLVSTALLSEDIPIPKSYKQAISDPTYGKLWKDAIEEEIRFLTANQTWEEVFTPKDTNLISSKWVFTIKSKPDGSFDRFKARLVAKGFTQRLGADYQETFAPTVQMATLRAFLAICAVEDLELVHFDVKNAFTEASPEESLFLRPPEGVDVKPGNALKILRSLYGFKQAARDWNQFLKSKILTWGFVQSLADPCLFSHRNRKINILIYVDDIAVAAKSIDSVNWFFRNMNECFNPKNLGDMEMFLGIRITRDRKEKTIWLDQQQYLERTLEKFGIPNAKHRPVSIPLDGYDSLTPANKNRERIDPKEYSMIIGSLMFAMAYTRADIAFALGRLSQYMKEPTKKHGQALKKLIVTAV